MNTKHLRGKLDAIVDAKIRDAHKKNPTRNQYAEVDEGIRTGELKLRDAAELRRYYIKENKPHKADYYRYHANMDVENVYNTDGLLERIDRHNMQVANEINTLREKLDAEVDRIMDMHLIYNAPAEQVMAAVKKFNEAAY